MVFVENFMIGLDNDCFFVIEFGYWMVVSDDVDDVWVEFYCNGFYFVK